MKKILLSVWLIFLLSTYVLGAVTVTFKVNGATSFNLPVPNGSTNISYTLDLSKPHTQVVVDGWIYIYVKPANGDAVRITNGEFIPVSSWNPGGNTDYINRSGSFGLIPGQLDYITGKVYAQFEENSPGLIYKSPDVTATVPIYENIITAPSKTLFEGAGDPGVITGSTPKGGSGSYTYQWESSTTSATGGFSNISGATGISYDPPAFSAPTASITTYYRRKATSGSLSAFSNTVAITKTLAPIANNVISYSGTATFTDAGDPTAITGNTPSGGNGSYSYQWQSANLANPSNFTDIVGATGQSYDPPTVQYTKYFRRKVTSGTSASNSNVITITIQRTGTTMSNPINIGNFNICSTYNNMAYNFPEYAYGNEYGNETDDVFYKFNLTTEAKVSIANCKQDGVSGNIYLLDASGNIVPGGTMILSCDVGYELVHLLQPGIYYIVSEGYGGDLVSTNYLPLYMEALPIFTISADVTIAAGTSTTLQASGSGLTYTWSPATGLSSTTGASVVASPLYTTTYMVWATSPNGCYDVKYITVNVTGSPGSTFNNPIVANIGGCGYYSGVLSPVGFGNDYGGPSEDIFYKFTLTTASEVSIYAGYGENNLHLVLLNSSGAFVDEQYYVNGADEGFTLVLADGTPLLPTLQPGTYYVVAEGSDGGNLRFGVGIETPAGYSCRKRTTQEPYTSSEQVADDDDLETSMYPNPAKDYVKFSLEQDAPATVHFMNTSGVEIKQATTVGKSATVSTSDLPAGLYLLKIIQGYTVYRKKLLIEK